MNTTTRLFGILSVAIVGLMFPYHAAYAATAAGNAQFVNGKVQVTTASGNTHLLKKGDAINEGDTVSTAVSASAQIKMKDGGFIAIRPDTKMKFDKFVFNGSQNGEEKSFLSLFKGGFRAVTGLIGKTNKQNYKITTTTATIGIRGTDHETFFVPVGSALVPAGAYSKVNVGETTLTTNRGTVNVLPNQMGYSSSMNEVPKIAPLNTNIFTVSAAPTKTIKEDKAEKEKQAGASGQSDKKEAQQTVKQDAKQDNKQDAKQDTPAANGNSADTPAKVAESAGDATSTRAADRDAGSLPDNKLAPVGAVQMNMPVQLQMNVPLLLVPIILTNAATGSTLNVISQTNTQGGLATTLTGASIFSAAYAENMVAVEFISSNGYGNTGGALVTQSGLVYVTGAAGGNSSSGALSSYSQQSIGGGSNSLFVSTITGGVASSFNAPSFAQTGIQYGNWTGYTGQTYTNSFTLGGNNGTPANWMYAPQGYIDTTYLAGSKVAVNTAMSATFTYQLDGANAPRYQNYAAAGTLTSASITANFTTMLVSASLGLTMQGNDNWGASISNQSFSAVGGGAFYGSARAGGTSNTLTVTHGVGTAATSCATCSGSLSGMFTGQNFSGAMLAYSLSDSAQGGTVSGDAALTRTGTVANATPAPTGMTVIDNGQGSLSTYSSSGVVTSSANVLTQYGSSSNSVTVNCAACTASASASGIYYGTWTSGTYSSTSSGSATGASSAPAYWITGPEAGPLYLPQALIGTASYSLDVGQISNSSGVAGTVKGTTTLAVNFSNQSVGINLDASIAGHTWNASTIAGGEAPLVGNQGIGGGAFHAVSAGNTGNGGGNNSNAGVLSVTVDGSASTSNYGNINGQLTGRGLNGAIISFALSGSTASYADYLNGVAAFSGVTQNVNTAYRAVLASTYDATTLLPTIGFYANNPARILQDAAGNLTQFDIQSVNGNGNNVTVTNSAATLTDHGTDPVSGISWGRWSGGTLNVTNRITNAVTSTALTGSLHWITESVATSAVTLPITGTYAYTYVGGTKPTDNLGNVGTLNSATVSANFTAQTVNLGVNASVNGATLNATGTNAPIIQQTAFYASSQEPASSSSYLTVSCKGTCAGTTGGTVIGKFTGAGATGVAMSYGLQNGSAVVSGVAAFHR